MAWEMSSIKNGLVAITNEVLETVLKEAEQTLRNAEKDAEDLLTKTREETAKTSAALIDEAKKKGEIEKKKAESLTEIEIRNRLLQAKEDLVNTVLEKVVVDLHDFIQHDAYHDYLFALIQEVAGKMGFDTLVIYVNSDDRDWLAKGKLDALSKKLGVQLVLGQKTEKCSGGCVIKTADGKVSYDNTFEKRLQQLKPALRIRIAKILFEEGVLNTS